MARLSLKTTLSALAILVVLAGLMAAPAVSVQAEGPFAVNTFTDSHDLNPIDGVCADASSLCSLRAAIEDASNSATPTTINLPAGTYNLSLGELDLAPNGGRTITLQGAGAASTIIHQDGNHRVLNIDFNSAGNTTVVISGVTISGGSDKDDNLGGAGILAGSVAATPRDSLTLNNCIVTANNTFQPNSAYTSQPGGGLQMAGGDLTVTACTFSHNTSSASQGGAIAYIAPDAGGTVSISGSTFDSNSMANNTILGPDGGGALYITSAVAAPNTVTISNSTFNNNSATAASSGTTFGGAIYMNSGVVNIDHSTFTANAASGAAGGQGGAIYVESGTLNLTFSRLVGNTATNGGSGVYNHASNAATTSATDDWWGCNTGPAAAPCNTAVSNAPASNLTATPWITLTHSAAPASIFVTQTSALTASFLHNSASQTLTSANVSALVGLPVTWGNAVLGTLSATQATIQANGQATATFTAGTTGGAGHADATVDGQTVTANLTVMPRADLAIVKSAPPTAVAGNTLMYTVTLTNNGESTAQNVSISDVLPAGLSFVSESQTSGTDIFTLAISGSTITDTISSLPSGASDTFQIVAQVSASQASASQISNTAGVSSSTFDPNPANNSSTAATTVSTAADLAVIKSGPSSVFTGGPLAYTLTLTNNGPSDAQSVSLADTLPTGTAFVLQSQSTGPVFTLSNVGSAIQDTISTLAAGASATFSVSATVDSGLAGGATLTNTAAASSSTSDLNPANNSDSTSATVDIALAFTSADHTTFTVGAAGTFTVAVAGYPLPVLTESGALPGNVTFTDNGDGTATLAGTPLASSGGSYALILKASNGVSSDLTQSFTLTVNEAPAFTSADHTAFSAGTAGSFTVTTHGFPLPALSETGALPGSVTFIDNGDGTATLAGTPPAGSGGIYVLSLKAANGVSTDAVQTFTLTVNENLAITSANNTTITVNTPGTFNITTIGFPTPALSESGSLPGGVSFIDNGNGTAALSGKPDLGTVGSYPLIITAHNGASPDAVQSFTLTIQKAAANILVQSAPSPSVFGQSVLFTADVTSAAGVPTGAVQFSVDGSTFGAPVTLSAGSATLSTSALAIGNHSVSADYPGDANFTLATTALAAAQVVNQADTTTTVSILFGLDIFQQPVTMMAVVTANSPGAGTPTGTVAFMDGANLLGTISLDGSGTATLDISTIGRGVHSFSASYSGDSNFQASADSKSILVPYLIDFAFIRH